MAKMGRPPAENPRSEKINFRMTKEEKARLEAYAAKKKIPISQVLLDALDLMYQSER